MILNPQAANFRSSNSIGTTSPQSPQLRRYLEPFWHREIVILSLSDKVRCVDSGGVWAVSRITGLQKPEIAKDLNNNSFEVLQKESEFFFMSILNYSNDSGSISTRTAVWGISFASQKGRAPLSSLVITDRFGDLSKN